MPDLIRQAFRVATSGAPGPVHLRVQSHLGQITEEHVSYMTARIPLGRVGEPEEVAALICWLASEDMTFSTGACFDISGGRAVY